jgi:hypothetical protein
MERLLRLEYPPIGTGSAEDGDWELRAVFDEAHGLCFSLRILARPAAGRSHSGGAGAGVRLATKDDPLVLTMSQRGPSSTNYWVGQAACAGEVDAVEFTLTDGSTVDATVVAGDLPVTLFVGVTDRAAAPIGFRAQARGVEIARLEIDEHCPRDGVEIWG